MMNPIYLLFIGDSITKNHKIGEVALLYIVFLFQR